MRVDRHGEIVGAPTPHNRPAPADRTEGSRRCRLRTRGTTYVADPKGFLTTPRENQPRRPVDVRITDWREVYDRDAPQHVSAQAGRCMDCGVPFCHNGCPLGNLIPEWNDLVWRDNWTEASARLHATNNFPEFTGRLCPAPCEAACVLTINSDAVTIKSVEVAIADRAWDEGSVLPQAPERLTGKTVAVVGSGPAGLAAAQQLTRAGHTVVVYERDDRIGGLMRYGIPDFKQERSVLDRRISQMEAEGTRFRTGVNLGEHITGEELRQRYDAVVLAVGALAHRELDVPGRELAGVHPAMEYLTEANRVVAGDYAEPRITAAGKDVLIIGGGDTGADCLGTAHRQGAKSVTQLQINARPPDTPSEQDSPWPTWPLVFRTAPAYEEGGERRFAMNTEELLDDGTGTVRAARLIKVRKREGRYERVEGTELEIRADLVLLAMGFSGPQRTPLLEQLAVEFDGRGRIARDGSSYATTVPGVYVAGDAGRGASLIVWAIAEGRAAAAEVDAALMGDTVLPAPVRPADGPLSVGTPAA